jgi:nitroreductase
MELGGGLLVVPALSQTPDAGPTNDTLRTIHSLRSIHGDFSDRQVPDRDVKAILGATIRAANASNMQSYSIIVVRDAAMMQKLTGYRGSCLLLYCVDYTRTTDTAKHMGYEYHAENMEAFITASTNTILAAQTAVIAARSLGIDSLLTNGVHRGDMERIWTLLELPQTSCFPLIALILGYPRTEPDHKKGRLGGSAVIHYEKYHRLTKEELGQIVLQYDDKAMQLIQSEVWEKKGYKHYLDWFYKEWARGGRTTSETQMFKRLKKSGFVDLAG